MVELRFLIVGILFGISSLLASTYSVDKSHTNVAFSVKHMMISTVNGEFQEYDGSFELDEKNRLTALNADIDVASINTNIQRRDAHLKSEEIFNADKYPKIKFILEKVDGDKAYGKLTIKDVTKDIELDYEFGGTITDPWGKQRAGFTLSGKIDRRDYHITWNQALEAGGVVVSEIVKINIGIQGIKEEDF